jgi:hypothetical protein
LWFNISCSAVNPETIIWRLRDEVIINQVEIM